MSKYLRFIAVAVLGLVGVCEAADPVVRLTQEHLIVERRRVCEANGICRVKEVRVDGDAVWSGVVIGRMPDKRLAVLTTAHGVTSKPITCRFDDRTASQADQLAIDKANDICLLAVSHPATTGALFLATQAPSQGAPVTLAGYGNGEYRFKRSTVKSYGECLGHPVMFVNSMFRQGDSGGAVASGTELVGVMQSTSDVACDGAAAALPELRKFVIAHLGAIPAPAQTAAPPADAVPPPTDAPPPPTAPPEPPPPVPSGLTEVLARLAAIETAVKTGTPGPVGPAGLSGRDGQNGAPGAPGAAGPTGTIDKGTLNDLEIADQRNAGAVSSLRGEVDLLKPRLDDLEKKLRGTEIRMQDQDLTIKRIDDRVVLVEKKLSGTVKINVRRDTTGNYSLEKGK